MQHSPRQTTPSVHRKCLICRMIPFPYSFRRARDRWNPARMLACLPKSKLLGWCQLPQQDAFLLCSFGITTSRSSCDKKDWKSKLGRCTIKQKDCIILDIKWHHCVWMCILSMYYTWRVAWKEMLKSTSSLPTRFILKAVWIRAFKLNFKWFFLCNIRQFRHSQHLNSIIPA